MTMTRDERSKMRAALLKAGVKTRGMDPNELLAAYEQHVQEAPAKAPEQPKTPDPVPTPAPAPKTPDNPNKTPQKDNPHAMTTPTRDPETLARTIADMIAAYGQPETPAMDEARIIELIKEHATQTIEIPPKKEGAEPIQIEGAHPAFKRVLSWLQTGTNVYLVGPAGSGKTTLAIHAARALELDFYSTGSVLAAYELLGFRDANGVYHPSALRTAYEFGGVFLFDEIDGCSAKALLTFNQLIENDRYTFPDGVVERHPDFRVIAGANTIGDGATRQYIGRNPLDKATKNRFVTVRITYDEKLETRLAEAEYKAHGGIETAIVHSWLEKVRTIRKQVTKMGANAIISPRQSIFGARGLATGLSVDEVLEDVILSDLSDDQRAQVSV